MTALQTLLDRSAARHRHLCPRQVLGVRMGLAGGAALGIELPSPYKRLLVILETDGCFADGVEVATGCSLGHRTLRVEDYGKVAATFIKVDTGIAIRINPHQDVREKAQQYAPAERRRYFTQLKGYQAMPQDELFSFQEVDLLQPIEAIVSRSGVRTECVICGEEIINQREVQLDIGPACKGCVGPAYYHVADLPISTAAMTT